MPNYKSKFNKNWMKLYPWVCEVDDDIYKAYCKWCKCEMKVDVRGIGAVKQHKETAKHKSIAHKISSLKQDSTGMHQMVKSTFSITCIHIHCTSNARKCQRSKILFMPFKISE